MRHQKLTILTLCAVMGVVLLWTSAVKADPITGSGTAGALSKFTGPNSIGDSVLYESNGSLSIGRTSPWHPSLKFDVNGFLSVGAGTTGNVLNLHADKDWGFLGTNGSMYIKRGTDMTDSWLYLGNYNSVWNIGLSTYNGDAYFRGNVMIGPGWPTQRLEVAGTIYSSTGGFKFPDGTVQTTAATGGGSSGWVDSGTNVTLVTSTDKVGIGTSSPSRTLTVRGNILIERSGGTAVMELGDGLDYAEGFDVAGLDKPQPGTVLVIDPSHPGRLTTSTKAYDTTVAGIAAGANNLGSGVRLGVGDFDCDVSLAGRVYCNVDATECAVQPGDLLTTSNTAGYAMKATDRMRAPGTVLGKAMQSLEQGQKGQILVLVTLQ